MASQNKKKQNPIISTRFWFCDE